MHIHKLQVAIAIARAPRTHPALWQLWHVLILFYLVIDVNVTARPRPRSRPKRQRTAHLWTLNQNNQETRARVESQERHRRAKSKEQRAKSEEPGRRRRAGRGRYHAVEQPAQIKARTTARVHARCVSEHKGTPHMHKYKRPRDSRTTTSEC
jgi:hypothetical protein